MMIKHGRQKAEGGRQKAEGRLHKAEGSMQTAVGKRLGGRQSGFAFCRLLFCRLAAADCLLPTGCPTAYCFLLSAFCLPLPPSAY